MKQQEYPLEKLEDKQLEDYLQGSKADEKFSENM